MGDRSTTLPVLVTVCACYLSISEEEKTVRYSEFRDRLEKVLQDAGLFAFGCNRAETIDLENASRHWKLYIRSDTLQKAEPFHISAEIGFDWSPFDEARAYTCEEDLLTELIGRRKEATRTVPRWKRVNLSLHASLPYGSTTLMPDPQLFGPWRDFIVDKVDAALTDVKEKNGRITAILGSHGDLEIEGGLQSDGIVFLKALAISGFRMVRVPRVWNDPGRLEAERGPEVELSRLARTFRATFDEWTKSVSELATWIRYSAPSSGAKALEPWFDDNGEDGEDGGPKTIQ
jgi:hypothetical protein